MQPRNDYVAFSLFKICKQMRLDLMDVRLQGVIGVAKRTTIRVVVNQMDYQELVKAWSTEYKDAK